MELTDNQKRMIYNMGALGYDVPLILSAMRGAKLAIRDEALFLKEFKNENSEIKKLYNEGRDYSQYQIDLKLHEMALSGDIKAIDKLETRKRMRK